MPHLQPVRITAAAAGLGLALLLLLRCPLELAAPSLGLALVAPTIAWADIDEYRIPDPLVSIAALGILLGAAAITIQNPTAATGFIRSIEAAIATAGLFILCALTGANIGLGDIKLLAVTTAATAWLSWESAVLSLTTSFIAAGLTAALLWSTRQRKATDHLPMAPLILLGWALAMVV